MAGLLKTNTAVMQRQIEMIERLKEENAALRDGMAKFVGCAAIVFNPDMSISLVTDKLMTGGDIESVAKQALEIVVEKIRDGEIEMSCQEIIQ
jgi:uncharacterized protein (UPF0335 family)